MNVNNCVILECILSIGGFDLAQDNSVDLQVGDTFQVRQWGNLTQDEIAQRGIEVIMGLVGDYHANCPSPEHFWCSPLQEQVFVLAELYHTSNAQGGDYLGCYLHGADSSQDGKIAIHERPSTKALMQPLDNGRVFVQFGRIAHDPSGRSSYGQLDRSTVEHLIVRPRPVPDAPADDGSGAAFIIQRAQNAWVIARCLQFGAGLDVSQAKVFAQVPVDPEPSPLSRLLINNFPAKDTAT